MSSERFRVNPAKRLLDVVLVALASPLLLPVGFLTALVVRIKLGSPVIFRQRRPGINSVPFTMLKFRTMTDGRYADGKLLPDAERLTSFGKFLRSTSLDELPEFINVLWGDMSLVGPRPLLLQYLDRYTPEQARRHEVQPGVTGLAQISGRNAISWEQKFDLDVWYVEHQSLWLDMKILMKTIFKIVLREGVTAEGEATAPEFTGSPSKTAARNGDVSQ